MSAVYIPEKSFQSRFTIFDFIRACDSAFCLYGKGILSNPPKKQRLKKIDGSDLFRLEMSAEWPEKYSMCKVIEEVSNLATGRLGSRTAVITLKDLEKKTEVSMDADYITDMRTGVAGALGIKYLSKRPIKRISVIGTGRIASKLVLALDTLFKPNKIWVTSRNPGNIKAFIRSMTKHINTSLQPAKTVAECVRNTDAIVCAVPALDPVLSATMLPYSVPISVIAGDPRSRQIEGEILETKTIVVDNLQQAYASGEFIYAKKNNRLKHIKLLLTEFGDPVTIGDVACNQASLNITGDIAYFTGLAAQDLLTAMMIYENRELSHNQN